MAILREVDRGSSLNRTRLDHYFSLAAIAGDARQKEVGPARQVGSHEWRSKNSPLLPGDRSGFIVTLFVMMVAPLCVHVIRLRSASRVRLYRLKEEGPR